MPVVEVERFLDDRLIAMSRPFPKRDRVSRPIKIWDIHDISLIDRSFDFLSRSVGYNVVITGDLLDFHREFARLFGCDACQELTVNKRIVNGRISLELASRDFNFFVVRMGNNWGSIYAIDESIDKKSAEKRYIDTISLCKKEDWDIDRLMPSGQMASDLLGRKVYWGSLPNLSSGDVDRIHLYRAWQCLKPPVLEAISLGNPGCTVKDYDINWAFPYALKNLPSYNPKTFYYIDSKDYYGDAIEGYLHCDVYLDRACIGPLSIRAGTKNNYHCYNPIGGLKGYWTKREIDLILEFNLGSVKILEGSWIIPKFSEYSKPFSDAVEVLERISLVEGMKGFAKSIAPTLWGKFASSYGSTWFNPCYASTVSAMIRERIMRIACENYDKIVAITADGLVSTNDLQIRTTDKIGGMKVRDIEGFLSLSDLYRLDGKNYHKWHVEEDGILLPVKRVGIPFMIDSCLDYNSIGDNLPIQKIAFGSSRRISPSNLRLNTLRNDYIPLSSPDEEQVAELVMSGSRGLYWEQLW